ncbi:cytochrome P450 [Ferruginibacter paludis]|uniref:cytochrome P450 n=1 Tax=Ferruginibacter paludis TaxID=1310417 RepID=UPI0025B2C57F|nr:cytochrome P450 [Ferruginibacter paludis]MDN3658649.1 cytochrome P450 [Ferruginibacter paludis]
MNAIKKSKLPPGPKTRLPLGYLFSFRKDSIGFLRNIAEEFGDIVHFKLGPIRIVLLNHPDFIKEVLTIQHRNFVKGRPLEMAKALLGEGLLTSEGEFHKCQSRIIQPAFHRSMIESYAPVITKGVMRLMKGWEDGMQVEIKEEMTKLSIAVAGNAFFNLDIEKEAPEINQALEDVTSLFDRIVVPFAELLLKLPMPGTIRFKKAKSRLDETIYRMIADRRKSKLDNGDLLSLLLRSQGQNGDEPGMSDLHLRDEALTLLLTAFDTTSTALTWAWYLLSQNPDAEAELHEELDRVLNGRLPTEADISQLKYTRMVLGESMRIFPPTYLIPRQALKDFFIDKYIVPGGTIILMSPYLIHHDPRFHPNPEKFDPHAWDKHAHGLNAKYEYFPFSRGPRSCIGEPFAWLHGILVLATMAQHWSLKMEPDHPVEFLQRINLRPRGGLVMTLQRRN